MLYMVIEHFHGGDPGPVYRRFREQGRMMPDGLRYVSSWIKQDLSMCWQIMECEDPALLDQWISNWSDLTRFEVIPVVTSAHASALVGRPSAEP
jgi:hypothetical protein